METSDCFENVITDRACQRPPRRTREGARLSYLHARPKEYMVQFLGMPERCCQWPWSTSFRCPVHDSNAGPVLPWVGGSLAL